MTTNYDLRPGQGSAFKNKDKTEDWQADYKGSVRLPDGTLHYVDIQPAKTKAGEWWFKVKIGKPKHEANQQQAMVLDAPAKPFGAPGPVAPVPAKPVPATIADMDDDLPF